MSTPVSAMASWAARRAQPGTGLGLGQLLLVRGQQPLGHRGQVIDVSGQPVDARQHLGQQDGVLGGEELRAFHRLLQLADLAAGRGAGQLGQHLGVALSGDEVVHDVPAGNAVQVCQNRGDLDRGRFQQLLRALLLPGAFFGQVPPVAGVQPDDPELRRGHEAGGDGAALEARRQPPRISRVPPGPAGQVPGLFGVGQHALEPLGLQPAERALPVVSGCLHHHCGYLPGPQPVRQCQHLSLGGAEAAGLSRTPCRIPIRGHPDRRHQPGLADVDAAHPVPVQRLVGHLFHASLTSFFPALASHTRWYRPGNRGRAEESNPRARSDNERPLGRPVPGVRLIRGLNRAKKETTSRAVPQPFFTPVRRRASGTKG
jgi:hypothetical protein